MNASQLALDKGTPAGVSRCLSFWVLYATSLLLMLFSHCSGMLSHQTQPPLPLLLDTLEAGFSVYIHVATIREACNKNEVRNMTSMGDKCSRK